MYSNVRERSRRVRRTRWVRAVGAFVLLLAPIVAFSTIRGGGNAAAAPAVAQTYYTPFEAQQFIDVLRAIAGNAGCCTSPVISTISITSGANGNTVYYDHFEDGYELDPLNPVQVSTVTIALDAGNVWTQTSNVPVDVSGSRGPGNFYDGRDRVSSTAPIAVTQAGYASGAGPLLASDAAVLDLDKSGLRYDIPAGQDADTNRVFNYTGLVIVSTADTTTVDLDLDSNGSFESTIALDEGETHVVPGGVMLGAAVEADKPVSVYVTTGDVGASYESRFFELYPTSIWANSYVSPVGAHSSSFGTRVFLFNPGSAAITIDVTTGTGSTSTVALGAGAQGSFLMPVDAGAEFSSQGGEPFYAFQMITTEGTSTSAYDWGYTLVPGQALTPSVVVAYGPGSQGLTNNYSPVWISPSADTTLYVDRDGDPSTGALTDTNGNQYDFSCVVGAFDSVNLYDDGTTTCYLPSESATSGGDRDMTGARLYTLDGARLAAAWGQRPNYAAGLPALDMGTAILPFPEMLITKSSVLSDDVDSDGLADAGDKITYTVTMRNLGIIEVMGVVLTDETPDHTSYIAGSTLFDTVPQSDNSGGFSVSPLDTDSPGGGFTVGTIAAGASREVVFSVTVDTPIPFGVSEIANTATMATPFGPASALNRRPVDVPPLQINKTSSPSVSPVGSGDTITYTVQVANADDAVQTGIDVTDVLPPGTTYVPGSVAAAIEGTPIAAGAPPALVTGAALAPDEILTITFDVTVDAPIAAGTTMFTNTGSASSDQFPTPISDDATDPAGPQVDLSLLKVDDEIAPATTGDPLRYTITVTNSGPDEADAVVVTDTLPAGVTFVAASSDPSCVEAPAGTITCSIGDLGLALVSFSIGVTVDATADGAITNTATVTSSTPEGNPGDETDTEDTLVDVPPVIVVTKTALPGSVEEPGGWVTFTVDIDNTSAEAVTLTALVDDVFGDLRDAGNPDVVSNTCAAMSSAIAGSGSATCSFDGFVAGDAGDPNHLNTVTATVEDDELNEVMDSGSATVDFTDALPVVGVTKSASVASVVEPGAVVTFTLVVSNASAETVTVASLDDDVFGDLLDGGNPEVSANTCASLPATLGVGVALSCSFDGFVAGNGADPDHVNTVTFSAFDDEGTTATDQANDTVAFVDAAPDATLTKDGSAGTVTEPGDTVTFTVTIDNDGPEPLDIVALDDSVFGDLLDAGNAAVFGNTCLSLPVQVAAGGWVVCWFDADLVGLAGDPDHVDTVTATLRDDEGTTISPADGAVVAFAPSGSTIGGLVFADLDRDGIRDAGETGIGGVEITVTGSGGSPTVLVTNANGLWSTAVLPGAATVEVDPSTVPAAYTLTTANESQIVIAVVAEHVAAEDVGYGPLFGSVEGVLYLDLDDDPNRDSYEPPLAGLDIEILNGAVVIDSTTSASDGSYLFTDLPAGSYTVRVVQASIPAGFESSVDYDGGADGSAVAVVVSATLTTDVDFGHRGTGTVGDAVWLDEDEDGLISEFEEPIAGVEVSLLWWGFDDIYNTADDYEFDPQVTDADGLYRFTDLPAGEYTLSVDTDGAAVDLDPTTPTAVDITLVTGATNLTADFGFVTDGELPYTGLAAENLLLASALMIVLGAVVFVDGRKREKKFDIAVWRIGR